ncbi:hypothetical protein [Leekyejoonella antrihumi]|uniref:Uncharacterized protein n=1 Tax=Leekyejoonella antrihumi TaxID=1660198 RepID=A0A563E1A2_9MICO|nr:hypothetical protein [Leekyejoonella antrihumi]TWP35952.1 hypothetical protein FGL98_12020 [Leekyejoonella antrihumi]
MKQKGQPSRQDKGTTTLFVSTTSYHGQYAAVAVTLSNGKDVMSAAQEAESFHGQLVDVEHVPALKVAEATWPGLTGTYQFTFLDPSVTPSLKSVVLMGETSDGRFVSVTAKAPPTLFDSINLVHVVATTRVGAHVRTS